MKKTRRNLSAFCVVALSLATGACADAGPAASVTVVEPIQPFFEPDSATHAIGGPSEQRLAQTLVIRRSGTLVGVYLPIGCDSGALEVEIRDVTSDEPDTAVRTSRRFPAGSIVTGVTVFRFFELPHASVSAGDRVALVLRNTGGVCGMASAPAGNPYSEGEGFFDARPNPPGWVRLFGRGVQDLAFQIALEIS